MHAAGGRPPPAAPDAGLPRSIRLRSAIAIVVANMIGSGIFTTTGFQAEALHAPLAIYLLWLLGGLLALCGALAYGELGAAMPRAGGEYVYLREAYGRSFAFMSALVSLTAGFSAPIASALKSLVRYAAYFVPVLGSDARLWGGIATGDVVAVALVWLLIAVHSRPSRTSIGFNDWVTLIKVVGIVVVVLGAVTFGTGSTANLLRAAGDPGELGMAQRSTALATALVFVMFCYSGWNAAAYLGGELVEPQRTLPRALVVGTLVVTGLYLALNLTYFYGATVEQLAGRTEVALVAAQGLFGPTGIALTSLVLCVSLLASASAMSIAGPRVYLAAGLDVPRLRFLARRRGEEAVPSAALRLQGLVTTVIILAGRIDQIQQYAGFTLVLFGSLAVGAVIVLRVRRPAMPRPFRTWGYPLTPLAFLAVSGWMMIWAVQGRPVESLLGLATVALGGLASSRWLNGR